ncbi:hypothetical protein [Fulvivirga lutea]|uniref:Uncharacterized protein n=1 Tax=Fulvivirga lutea TaxID=2810512 RepID=A0A975A0W1_9BACT|nr:hypothetical protein [Fulvivirga lutea]QSE97211.1 hypothetical protein JR347_16715 [Fulvivirga lutea]
MDKLLIAVLGHSNSGKSTTWNQLFGRTVKTGIYEHDLYLNSTEYVKVFLVSGSPEERQKYVGKLITVNEPKIVLCSMQYREDVRQTIDYFVEREYQIYCQWLNPGYQDSNEHPQFDNLGVFNYLQGLSATVGIRNGKINASSRVQEIREFIYGWAKYKNLILS